MKFFCPTALLTMLLLLLFAHDNTICTRAKDADLAYVLTEVLGSIQPEIYASISNETRVLLHQSECAGNDIASDSLFAIDCLANALSERIGNRPMVRIKKPTIVYEAQGNSAMPLFVPSHISIRFGKHKKYGYVLIFHPSAHLSSLPCGITNVHSHIYFSPHKF